MRKGFALIYVLLLTFVMLMAMATVVVALVSDIKLTNQSKATTQAYSMALSGIADGWGQYKNGNTSGVFKYPLGACRSGNHEVNYYDSDSGGYIEDQISLTTLQSKSDYPAIKKAGFYAFRVCSSGGTSDFIESRGYANGQEVSLRADIVHSGAVDKIKVYQINSY